MRPSLQSAPPSSGAREQSTTSESRRVCARWSGYLVRRGLCRVYGSELARARRGPQPRVASGRRRIQEMQSIDGNLATIAACGYAVLAHFTLPVIRLVVLLRSARAGLPSAPREVRRPSRTRSPCWIVSSPSRTCIPRAQRRLRVPVLPRPLPRHLTGTPGNVPPVCR